MFHDSETNTVHISTALGRHLSVYQRLLDALRQHHITVRFIEDTQNIWARDFMPLQVGDGFVKFKYKEGYGVKKYRKWRQLKVPKQCYDYLPNLKRSSLVLDGGNCQRHGDRAIVTDIVYAHNRDLSRKEVLKRLEKDLQAQVTVIPREPYDTLGHSDGMVKFQPAGELLINDYPESKWKERLYKTLIAARLVPISFPWFNFECTLAEMDFRLKYPQADDFNPGVGYYINLLAVKGLVLVPQFGIHTDEAALAAARQYWPGCTIEGLHCYDLAMEGGLVNCVTMNYKR